MVGGVEFDIDAPDLRGILQSLREVDPKLATSLRRELRTSGDVIIAGQRQILSGSKPGSVSVAKREWRIIRPKNRKAYIARRNVYEMGPEDTGGVPNLRDQIAQGLKTRVVAGKTRQAVQIRTTGPNNDGYNMAKIWQKKLFRHPVFGTGAWMYQQGQPYFFGPIKSNEDAVRQRIADAIETTLRSI